MNLKTGDRVKFLNDIGAGRIKGFKDSNYALVEMDDGFEIPMKLSELVKVKDREEEQIDSTSMKQTIASKETIATDTPDHLSLKSENGIFLAFVKSGPDKYTLNIINDTDYTIQYFLGRNENDTVKYMSSGELEDNTKIIIDTFSYETLKDLGILSFQAILFGKKNFEIQEPIKKTIDLKSISLLNSSFTENEFYEEKALIIKLENDDLLLREIQKLSNSDINAVIKIKDQPVLKVGDFLKKSKNPAIEKSSVKKDFEEVDLHIENIVEDHSSMTSGEIINAQLSRFEIALNGAIRNNIRRIVFIHGIGNGKLKYELSKILDRKYPDLKYQDASFKEYGYGAMMVIIKN